MANEIIINRMFSGSYLEDDENIGHEIINLYRSDDKPDKKGGFYVYLIPTGDYSDAHRNSNINGILLVRGINADCVEVMAKAEGIENVFNTDGKNWVMLYRNGEFEELAKESRKDGSPLSEKDKEKRENFIKENKQQRDYIKNNDITYGGVLANELFDGNPEAHYNMSLFITYKADAIRMAREPFYLITGDEHAIPGRKNFVIKRARLAGSAGTTFYREDGNIQITKKKEESKADFECRKKECQENEKYNYQRLMTEILSDESLWKDTCVDCYDASEIHNDDTFSFLTIAKKEYDEIAYSNAFVYFFEKYPKLLESVLESLKDINDKELMISIGNQSTKIEREEENIDILIKSETCVVVIENKIKSKINGLKHDIYGEIIQNQLDKYFKYVEAEYAYVEDRYYLIFTPNYNKIDTDKFKIDRDTYKIVTYRSVYQAMRSFAEKDANVANDNYFADFMRAIKKHTQDIDNNYEEIMKRKMKALIEKNGNTR